MNANRSGGSIYLIALAKPQSSASTPTWLVSVSVRTRKARRFVYSCRIQLLRCSEPFGLDMTLGCVNRSNEMVSRTSHLTRHVARHDTQVGNFLSTTRIEYVARHLAVTSSPRERSIKTRIIQPRLSSQPFSFSSNGYSS